jgi:hypothetical protein
MELTIDLEGFARLDAAFRQAPEIVTEEMDKFARAAVRNLESDVKDFTPVRTGHLSDSIIGVVTRGALGVTEVGVLGVVGTVVPYAIPVELGAKPHRIEARNKQALHFGNITVRAVNHPGTPAFGMFHRAFAANRPILQENFTAAIERALRRIAQTAS